MQMTCIFAAVQKNTPETISGVSFRFGIEMKAAYSGTFHT